MRPAKALGALAIVVLLASASCGGGGGGGSDQGPDDDPPASAGAPRAVTFAKGLDHPWGLAFLGDGSMLVTERSGALRHVSADGLAVSAPIAGVPAVVAKGQGGLLDVAFDPDFASTRRVYFSYAEADAANAAKAGTAVAHGRLSDDRRRLTDVTVIFRQQPKLSGGNHFGGRLVFDGASTLFVTLGERYRRDQAQDLGNDLGKVLRLTREGEPASGNPFADRAGAVAEVWSYGHRNPQGAALHPKTGQLWVVEHGPQGGDEINIARAGRNYGWPLISYGCEYGADPAKCTPVGGASAASGLEQPLTYWVPSIAPSGLAFYTGDRFPEWKGSLFTGALAGQALWRLTLDGNEITSREALFEGLGERIRDVRQGPDGWLYLLTDSDAGRIVRIER